MCGTGMKVLVSHVTKMISNYHLGYVAQLVEHSTDNRKVPGSSPGVATKNKISFCIAQRLVKYRSVAQLAEQWPPKPKVVSSILTTPAK